MWFVIFCLTLAPIIVGGTKKFPTMKVYFGLAILLMITIIPVHMYLNHKADPNGGYKDGHYLIEVGNFNIVKKTGTFAWRFFEYGLINKYPGKFHLWLARDLNLGYDFSKKLDISNPTPFHILIWFLLLAAISSRQNRAREVMASDTTQICNKENANDVAKCINLLCNEGYRIEDKTDKWADTEPSWDVTEPSGDKVTINSFRSLQNYTSEKIKQVDC